MMLPVVVAAALAGVIQQDSERVERLVAASFADAPELVSDVRGNPDAAREAFGDLLRMAVERPAGEPDPIAAAEYLAAAYFQAWSDPFLSQEARRFRAWSAAKRRLRVDADSLRLAGNRALGVSGVEAAVSKWRQSLTRAESIPDTAGIARALGNLGAGYYTAGQTDSASAYLSDAYDMAVTVGDLRTAAGALTNLASINYEHGEYAEAAAMYGTSLDLLERTGDTRFLSANWHNLALVSLALGDVAGAQNSLEESVRLSRLHGYAEDEAEGLSVLADLELAAGDYGAAQVAVDGSLELARSTGNRAAEAGAHHTRGLLEAARGAYRRAENDLTQAIRLYDDLGMRSDAAEARIDRATVLGVMGEIGEGLRDLYQAEQEADVLDLGPMVAADAALAAGDLHALLNEDAAAAAAYRRAGQSYRAAADAMGEVAAHRGRGLMELRRGNPALAADGFREALRAEGDRGQARSLAISEMYLAYALLRAGDTLVAHETLSRAVERAERIGDPVMKAALLGAFAGHELQAGRPARADSLYRTALATLGNRDVPDVAWRLHAGRAEALVGLRRHATAETQLGEAVAAIESAAASGVVDLRAGYLDDKWQVYADLAAMQVRRGDPSAAFLTAERLRAGRMLANLASGRTTSPPDDISALRSREQDLRRRMVAIRAQLYRDGRGPAGLRESAETSSISDLESALRSTQEDYAEVIGLIRRGDREYAFAIDPAIPRADQVVNQLRSDEALVEYVVGDSATVAIVLSSEGVRTR